MYILERCRILSYKKFKRKKERKKISLLDGRKRIDGWIKRGVLIVFIDGMVVILI